jgi:tRNA modification GTPase
MSLDIDDTIAAIATAAGGGLRGIVRVSGPCAVSIANSLFEFTIQHDAPASPSKLATCRRGALRLTSPLGEVPATLYLWPTSSSYTRQPSAEFHLPGSPPILEAALQAICRAGARIARPGEFTLRAFLAGRLDLTQAEAVLGIIDAHDRRQLSSALAQLAGGLARPLGALRQSLLELLAHLEAGLDFADEDIEFIGRNELQSQLSTAENTIASLMNQMRSRGQFGAVRRIVLAGLPNVGKSSLLNVLAGESAAIVSSVAGTTRDFVTRQLIVGDLECLITDAAGLEFAASGHEIDASAQSHARQQIAAADLTLLCLDCSHPARASDVNAVCSLISSPHLSVWTKCDLPQAARSAIEPSTVYTSSRTGEGLRELRATIGQALQSAAAESGTVTSTADRCRDSLRLAAAALARARSNVAESDELVAAEIRVALDELGAVVGAVYTDDILDRVFSRFCIGK